MNIYVGNIPFNTTEETLQDAFAEYGTVERINIIKDMETGRSQGFAFVTMPDDAESEAAIAGLNNATLEGRQIKVNQARPREDRPRGRDNHSRKRY